MLLVAEFICFFVIYTFRRRSDAFFCCFSLCCRLSDSVALRIFDISLCSLRVFLFVLSASSCLTIMLSILVALFLSSLLAATVFHILFLLAIASFRVASVSFMYERRAQWAPKLNVPTGNVPLRFVTDKCH